MHVEHNRSLTTKKLLTEDVRSCPTDSQERSQHVSYMQRQIEQTGRSWMLESRQWINFVEWIYDPTTILTQANVACQYQLVLGWKLPDNISTGYVNATEKLVCLATKDELEQVQSLIWFGINFRPDNVYAVGPHPHELNSSRTQKLFMPQTDFEQTVSQNQFHQSAWLGLTEYHRQMQQPIFPRNGRNQTQELNPHELLI